MAVGHQGTHLDRLAAVHWPEPGRCRQARASACTPRRRHVAHIEKPRRDDLGNAHWMPVRLASLPSFAGRVASCSPRNPSALPSSRPARRWACSIVQRMVPQDRGNARGREWRERSATERDLWLERYGDGVALHAGSGSQAACAGRDAEGRPRERNYNIYSLTWAGGEGRRAKIKMKSRAKNFAGAVERKRLAHGKVTAKLELSDS
jgi:hypothetical protein